MADIPFLIKEASKKLRGIVERTPLVYSTSFSRMFGASVYLKLENLQKTGSFKVRGAYNKISSLSSEEKDRGVITASSGNHAQGVAWASALLKVKCCVVMPETSQQVKQTAASGYGANLTLKGKNFGEAYDEALKMAAAEGITFIPPYDDDLVIAGQGTIGIEILEDLSDVDTVIVPVGGGGLISGIATALKHANPNIRVYGVEADAATSCVDSLREGHAVPAENRPTIADGIAVKKVSERTFNIIREKVEDVVIVAEDSIAEAVLKFMERKKLVVEGAGAVPLAALIENKIPKPGNKVVLVVSGGNIDVTVLDRIIRLGLVKEGRGI
ncbi:MAG: threonine ammonia-lyase [Deltaproteobacteria bacterium]|nr:threonine ammonia-lyase [Deltaproteobacteria bacterium]